MSAALTVTKLLAQAAANEVSKSGSRIVRLKQHQNKLFLVVRNSDGTASECVVEARNIVDEPSQDAHSVSRTEALGGSVVSQDAEQPAVDLEPGPAPIQAAKAEPPEPLEPPEAPEPTPGNDIDASEEQATEEDTLARDILTPRRQSNGPSWD